MNVLKERREAAAGASAGVIGTVLGYPLDSIKTRMQVQRLDMISSARSIYSEASLAGFYRGVVSPLLALTLLNTLNFSSYAAMRAHLGIAQELEGFEWRVAVAGAAVGPLSAMISTPFDLVKTQMQLLSGAKKAGVGTRTGTVTGVGTGVGTGTGTGTVVQFRNSLQAAVFIVRQGGVAALYRAHGVNSLREVVFLGTYFSAYEHLRYVLRVKAGGGGGGGCSGSNGSVGGSSSSVSGGVSGGLGSLAVPMSGGLAGALGWLVSFPLDCVKSNMQAMPILSFTSASPSTSASAPASASTTTLSTTTTASVARQLVASKGIIGLYTGVVPSLLRAFLVSSSRFSAYETTLWLIDGGE
ncbi:mitochondrial carrier domain-containing protein [Ochromonadaceae sp. CCMP2298]|nr:mitochondrial carrier domain-containing protein [Ochromonadaceae sp. CCMP2298]